MKCLLWLFVLSILYACSGDTRNNTQGERPLGGNATHDSINTTRDIPIEDSVSTSGSGSLFREQQVPVLCYHHIKNCNSRKEIYTVSEAEFSSQLKMLSDSGYQTILPSQLYDYLTAAKSLPPKPVMLTFDDNRLEHFTVAASEMTKYGFKGVFFIMNISIGKPGYMTEGQIKSLSDSGNTIGCHTWDHHNVNLLHTKDWSVQIDQPKAQLEKITGKPVEYFSYPFGVWTDEAVSELKNRGIKAAFQLNGKMDQKDPLYTIRRMIVPCGWTSGKLKKYMVTEFKHRNK